MGNYIGIIEMALSGGIVLGFCAWQYWLVRDAGKPKPAEPMPGDPSSDLSGVSERDHETDDGRA
jgi:hypothetical protein